MAIGAVPRQAAGGSWRIVIAATIASALATLWLPPVGAACFLATTVYAVRRIRRTALTVALVALTAVAVLATPGVFLSGHAGTGGSTGPPPAPAAPGQR
jgi:hypothetical protein